MILAIVFYFISYFATDEDLMYKENGTEVYSTLSKEFSNLEMVGEVLPHFILNDEDDKFMEFRFVNDTYFKNMTYDDGQKPKEAIFEELYYFVKDTKGNLPHLMFRDHNLPIGDSKSSCLHIKYKSKKEQISSFDKYHSVLEMPQCFGHREEIWNDEDPTTGINLLVWKEFTSDNKTNCRNGIMKENTCYEYAVMTKICIIIHPYKNNPTKGWYLKDGCYDGGSAIQYERAQPGREYLFEDIPIEVWAHRGAFYEFETSMTDSANYLYDFHLVSVICWILCLISTIVFILYACFVCN